MGVWSCLGVSMTSSGSFWRRPVPPAPPTMQNFFLPIRFILVMPLCIPKFSSIACLKQQLQGAGHIDPPPQYHQRPKSPVVVGLMHTITYHMIQFPWSWYPVLLLHCPGWHTNSNQWMGDIVSSCTFRQEYTEEHNHQPTNDLLLLSISDTTVWHTLLQRRCTQFYQTYFWYCFLLFFVSKFSFKALHESDICILHIL